MPYVLNEKKAEQIGAMVGENGIRMNCCIALHRSRYALVVSHGKKGHAIWHCHAGCDYEDLKQPLIDLGVLKWSDNPVEKPLVRKKTPDLRGYWNRIEYESLDPLIEYFKRRGLDENLLEEIQNVAWDKSKKEMVCRVLDNDRNLVALHRTRISDRKRRIIGSPKGGAIRLTRFLNPKSTYGNKLTIAEGVETALAYLEIHKFATVWSVLSSGNMKKFQLPSRVSELVIAADFDAAGLDAAESLERSLRKDVDFRETSIALPPKHRQDWLDHLNFLKGETE